MPRRAFTLIELVVCLAVVGLLAGLTAAGAQRARAAADRARCQNQLRQVALALHQHHQAHRALPPGTSGPHSDMPFVAWPARVLPFLEREQVWRDAVAAFKIEKDFLKPPHAWLSEPMPAFACASDWRTREAMTVPGGDRRGPTSYLGVEGINAFRRDGVLYLGSETRLADITDGTSNTLMVGERPPSASGALGWWYAGWGLEQTGSGDAVLGVRAKNLGNFEPGCDTGPYHFRGGKLTDACAAFAFWSPHAGGSHFALADGSVRFLRYEADAVMPALATRAGGEAEAVPD
jgi:prepilin-type N-terminal cleavage/methylation domain-containing protein/prepilin-type processing-associated H-X9-DG protein